LVAWPCRFDRRGFFKKEIEGKPMAPQTEELLRYILLRDIEERWIPELREQLDPLQSGRIRIAEIRQDGSQVDTTAAKIIWLNRWIKTYQQMAANLRDGASD
jgi:hypothetical protein